MLLRFNWPIEIRFSLKHSTEKRLFSSLFNVLTAHNTSQRLRQKKPTVDIELCSMYSLSSTVYTLQSPPVILPARRTWCQPPHFATTRSCITPSLPSFTALYDTVQSRLPTSLAAGCAPSCYRSLRSRTPAPSFISASASRNTTLSHNLRLLTVASCPCPCPILAHTRLHQCFPTPNHIHSPARFLSTLLITYIHAPIAYTR